MCPGINKSIPSGGRVPGVRKVALDILLNHHLQPKPLDATLKEFAGALSSLERRDRQLLLALVHETLRYRGYLDKLAGRYSKHPIARMKPLTLNAIRLGLVQLLFFDRIPPSAAINETIKALKSARQPAWLTGFVNALLRSAARDIAKLNQEKGLDQTVLETYPPWLLKRWRQQWGEERALARCRANNAPPPLVLRVNPRLVSGHRAPHLAAPCDRLHLKLCDRILRLTRVEEFRRRLQDQGLEVQTGSYLPDALLLPRYHGPIEKLPGYHQGSFSVQDEAAQLVTLLMFDPQLEDQRIAGDPGKPEEYLNQSAKSCPQGQREIFFLDACAGLGGKTGQLAELLPENAWLTALEPNADRFALLRENLQRLGFSADASVEAASAGSGKALGDGLSGRHHGEKKGGDGGQRGRAPRIMLHQVTLEEFAAGRSHISPPCPTTGSFEIRQDSESCMGLKNQEPGSLFSAILVDAPCSGLGVIRRHPDIRWNRRADDLARYRRRQIELLQAASSLLAPGGILVYVVCSSEPEENQEVVERLLELVPALKLSDPRGSLPPDACKLVDNSGFFRSFPEHGMDGFFAARLVREADCPKMRCG